MRGKCEVDSEDKQVSVLPIDASQIENVNKPKAPTHYNPGNVKIIRLDRSPLRAQKDELQTSFNSNNPGIGIGKGIKLDRSPIKASIAEPQTSFNPHPNISPDMLGQAKPYLGIVQRENKEIDAEKILAVNKPSASENSAIIKPAPGSDLLLETQSGVFSTIKIQQTRLKFFTELFPDLSHRTIEHILKTNQDCADDLLFEIILAQCSENQVCQNKPKNDNYKKVCPDSKNCSNAFCEFFHFKGERRRVLDNYSSKMCRKKPCPGSENCAESHTLTEVHFHPNIYKKLSCPYKACPLGDHCVFSHDFQKKSGSLSEKLEEEFEDLLTTKKSTQEVYQIMDLQIEEFHRERLNLRQKLVCCICDVYRIEFVTVCSHSFCGVCVKTYKNGICPKCNRKSEVIKIDYS